jgi:hypothetical protein
MAHGRLFRKLIGMPTMVAYPLALPDSKSFPNLAVVAHKLPATLLSWEILTRFLNAVVAGHIFLGLLLFFHLNPGCSFPELK